MFLKKIVIYKKLKIYNILFLYYIILLKPKSMHLLHKCDTSKLQVYEVDEYIHYLEDKIIHYTSIIFNYSECEWDYFDKYSRSDSKNKFYQCGIFKENKLYCGMHIDNDYINEGEFHENGRLKKGKLTDPNDYITEGEFNLVGKKHGYCYVRHPKKQSKDGYYLNGELFNHKHKKWKKQDDEILNTHFMKPIYFIKKIHKLAEKLGWVLVREGNHKIYKREEDTLILSSTPGTGFYDYYHLRDKEIERILKN